MKNHDAFLECKELKKHFRSGGKDTLVINGLNLQVHRGEIVVIYGRSGAGKSTLIGLLAGLERPTSGEVTMEKNSYGVLSNEELALLRYRKMGIIFQNFNLLSSWTAFENVQTSLMHRGLSKKDQRGKIEALLNELGMNTKYNNLPSELSIGEQQRVAVARALVSEPELILADEPAGYVDAETGQAIINYLVAAVRKKNAAMVLVTHGEELLNIGDVVLKLENGNLISY